jgi:hypothetical protein
VQGAYEELAGPEAERAIALLGERFGRADGSRRHGEDGSTVVFRIRIEDVTGRFVRR